ncbi:MAG: methyltransferase domain-containing protein [Rhizobiaceae bacterium]|nr:methyltransferase domain-containing protein [Rhizobiaceae bacterium]
MLFADGDYGAAASLMMDALERAPNWSIGWLRLGEYYEAAGEMSQAVEAWNMALKIDPSDRAGATLKLAIAGAIPHSSRPPSAFVEALFDQYADRFEFSLLQKLGYRLPDLLLRAIHDIQLGPFELARDLGCGTGLMGERLRPNVNRLEGFDISAEMLRRARAKGIYDLLTRADLHNLREFTTFADLVTATDVFNYVGALDEIVSRIAAMQQSGGLFAFSVERHTGIEDFALLTSRRYAHSQPYVERVLASSGYDPLAMTTETIRMDRNEPIEGILVVARKH